MRTYQIVLLVCLKSFWRNRIPGCIVCAGHIQQTWRFGFNSVIYAALRFKGLGNGEIRKCGWNPGSDIELSKTMTLEATGGWTTMKWEASSNDSTAFQRNIPRQHETLSARGDLRYSPGFVSLTGSHKQFTVFVPRLTTALLLPFKASVVSLFCVSVMLFSVSVPSLLNPVFTASSWSAVITNNFVPVLTLVSCWTSSTPTWRLHRCFFVSNLDDYFGFAAHLSV